MDEQRSASMPKSGVRRGIIGRWLAPLLMLALMGNVGLSALLIIRLSRSEEAARQAEEVERELSTKLADFLSLKRQLEPLAKQKDDLARQIAEQMAEWEKHRKLIDDATARLSTLDSTMAEAKNKLDGIVNAIRIAEEKKKGLDDLIASLEARSITTKITNDDILRILSQAADAERLLREHTAAVKDAETRRKRLDAEATLVQADLDQLNAGLEQLKTDIAKLRKERDEMLANKAALAQERDKLRDDDLPKIRMDAATAATERDKNQLDAAKTKLELANTKQLLAVANKLLAEANASRDQVVQDHDKIVAQKDVIAKGLGEVRAEAASLDAQVAKAKADLLTAETQAKAARELAAEKAQLTRDIATHKAERDDLKGQKEKLEREIGELKAKLPKPEPASETPSEPATKQ